VPPGHFFVLALARRSRTNMIRRTAASLLAGKGAMTNAIRVYVVEFGDRPHYQMQWRDPITGRLRTRSTRIANTGLARDRKQAERIAGELEAKLNAGEAVIPSRFRWEEFRKRYEAEVVPGLATRTGEKIASVLDRFEREINPQRLWDVDEKRLSAFVTRLRKGDPDNEIPALSESTIAGHLAHLKAAMNWAKSQKLIVNLPAFPKMKRAKVSKGGKVMRGRPITTEEFERMLGKVQEVVGKSSAASWTFYLRGLWTSGLRLTESLELYWDREDKLHPVLTGKFPMLRIPGDLEKGHKDRLLPMAPEFAELLRTVPASEQCGPVFKLDRVDGKPGRPASERVSKIVSNVGARAKVRVDAKKTASAHDLRRAFGERWAARLMPAQLMELMRHESIETTLSYYVGRNAERTAAILWHEHDKATSAETTPEEKRPV
jgi:integrase